MVYNRVSDRLRGDRILSEGIMTNNDLVEKSISEIYKRYRLLLVFMRGVDWLTKTLGDKRGIDAGGNYKLYAILNHMTEGLDPYTRRLVYLRIYDYITGGGQLRP